MNKIKCCKNLKKLKISYLKLINKIITNLKISKIQKIKKIRKIRKIRKIVKINNNFIFKRYKLTKQIILKLIR